MKSNAQPFTGQAFSAKVVAIAQAMPMVVPSDFSTIRAQCNAKDGELPDGSIAQILQDADIRVVCE